ncbi:FecR family protein [Mucilaginibacter sp. SP1R1]|uniref:FecR family protein n=1 Tax=Mucilaginibacter sp. SP1R1 TaxID=2723091 RepID=UPI001612FD5A|nr:FecR domain-containing protein [Mucilaginibacter sp. SP1R1]MBB6149982.1 ferric-dicitrate binding protein FerR (iron transport regulator) [Mucilaginibacter sp. SP1R1]
MNQDIIALLRKYIGNSCTQQELEKVRLILSSRNYEQEWITVLAEEALNDMADNSDVHDFDSKSVLNCINATIKPVHSIGVFKWSLGIAASLLLILSAGYLLLKSQAQPNAGLQMLSVTTAAGQQKKVIMPDGTEIVLNSGSMLSYRAKFVDAKREVYLNGEAFFNVKHDSNHPFLVHTGSLNVQVLGTSFNVRSYPADTKTMVSVATGKVGVNSLKPTATYMLLPGDRLSYSKKKVFKKDNVAIEDIFGWQKGILIFRLETIEDIAPILERYYGVNIQIKASRFCHKQVTASFTQKTLPQVLEILSQTAGFNYTINKNEVHIN